MVVSNEVVGVACGKRHIEGVADVLFVVRPLYVVGRGGDYILYVRAAEKNLADGCSLV